MIFTNQEMSQLQSTLENQSGLDKELLERCGPMIHLGKFDEAVRSAFVLLEERLRTAVNKDGMTGTRLALYAFDADDGPLAKHLGKTKQERLGLENLYAGAFRLFRNPTAHSFIGYGAIEGKAIVSLVNLLLIFLERTKELPPPDTFIEPVESFLEMVDKELNPGVASRLRMFLGKCKKLGLDDQWAKKSLPFRSNALQTRPQWTNPKPYRIALFYLIVDRKKPSLYFPVNQYYKSVVDLKIEPIETRLRELGFIPYGGDYSINLRDKNTQVFFGDLYNLVAWIEDKFRATL